MHLYIHIPFCRSKCRYCDFYSAASFNNDLIRTTLLAMNTELVQQYRAYNLEKIPVKSIYIGGGTPSIISAGLWQEFFSEIKKHLIIDTEAEITIECNPESFTDQKARAWLATGVNRLSIGIQSLNDRTLRFIGRPHSSEVALSVLLNPLLDNFKSVSVDCIYGIPGQTIADLNDTLNAFYVVPAIKHISAYELTIAEETPFGRHQALLPLPNEEKLVAQAEAVHNSLSLQGFERYEVSNFCRPGFESCHNSAYWSHANYLGIGPAAHSYINGTRWGNVSIVEEYLKNIGEGCSVKAFEELSDKESKSTEIYFLRMRTAKGISISEFEFLTGKIFLTESRKLVISILEQEGLVDFDGKRLSPTKKGMDFADGITEKLMR